MEKNLFSSEIVENQFPNGFISDGLLHRVGRQLDVPDVPLGDKSRRQETGVERHFTNTRDSLTRVNLANAETRINYNICRNIK